MKITYSLSADDLLQYQLYFISQNKSLKRRRVVMRWLIGTIYIVIGFQLYYSRDTVSSLLIFGGFGLIWLIFYPYYSRWRYRNYYKKQILESNPTKIDKETILEFEANYLFAKDGTSESKIDYNGIHQLIELKNQLLIKLDNASSIVIPKGNVENLAELKIFLEQRNIPFVDNSGWKWK